MTHPTVPLRLTLGSETRDVSVRPGERLSEVLREQLGCKSVKVGCDAGDCGACTILVDGRQTCACLIPAIQADSCAIETLETVSDPLSDTLKKSFLRHGAAQCGICTPGILMAAIELLREKQHPTEQEVEDALGGVLCRCTGYRKIVTAIVEANSDAPDVSIPRAGQSVGAPIPRLDGQPKVDGSEVFGADYNPDGTLLVRAIRSPYFHATFTLGDAAAWLAKTPGLETIITSKDIKGENCFGVIPPLADQPALAEKHVRFLGEAVALVVGRHDVVEALDLGTFPITWSEIPHCLAENDASLEAAPQVHETRPGNSLIRGKVCTGDPDEALRQSAHVVSASVETSYVEHAYIEPEAGIGWLDGDTLVIQACTQAPVMDQEDTAKVLGLPKDLVRIIPSAAGGGFGSKLDVSVQPLIGLAVLKTRKPCRMVFSRNESMRATTKRHPGTMHASIGVDNQGLVTGMVFHGDFNTGAYASWGPTVATRVPVHASGPYKTPNYKATSHAIHTNGPSSGAFRGFGVPQAAIMQEMIYDQLADACKMDRLAFRVKNALRDGDAAPFGQTLQAVGLVDCLHSLETHWTRANNEVAAFNKTSSTIKRGLGIASCWYGCGNTALPNPSTIRIGVQPSGRVVLHQGATDIGQGANTVIAQIAADAIGIPIDCFDLVGPDTAKTPDCGKTSASRQTYITGKAAEKAGRALRAEILRLTNLSDAATLNFGEGVLTVTDGASRQDIQLQSLDEQMHGYVLMAEETYDPPTTALDENGQGRPYAVYGYGAQLAEVEVNTALGTTRVRHIVAAHDVGRVINPILAEGQIEGGIAQGLGLALMEEFIPGRTENLHDYLIPTIGDMPPVTSILIEKPDPEGPMGAKGLGEHVLIPTAPAILNGIRHATGATITKVPALPHRVLAAIKAKT